MPQTFKQRSMILAMILLAVCAALTVAVERSTGGERRAPTSAVPAKVAAVATQANSSPPAPATSNPDPAAKPVDASPGGVYHSGALGFSYTYPKGWTVATPETLRNANASIKAAAAVPTGKDPSQRSAVINAPAPELILYVYGPPSGDAKNDPKSAASFPAIPSVYITSQESFGAMLTPEIMKGNAGAQEKRGMKIIRGPEKFAVTDQNLYRMDFENTREGHTWVSIIQTVAYDHVLTIEIVASSPAQLELLVSTVKNSVFADADKN
jgi:hypothetical protein